MPLRYSTELKDILDSLSTFSTKILQSEVLLLLVNRKTLDQQACPVVIFTFFQTCDATLSVLRTLSIPHM